jgi:signal transduction histidine kinase
MRRALGVLREDAAYAPAPGLAVLGALAERARAGGVDVELDVRWDVPAGANLPDAVALTVYRIVQESLTNAVKHAAPARCQATVTVDQRQVRIAVTDDGCRAGAPAGGGHGLIGMRERVTMYGGDLTAGPRPDGGFAVTVRLPYESLA